MRLAQEMCKPSIRTPVYQIQAKEFRSLVGCGRPLVGVGGLATFRSYNVQSTFALYSVTQHKKD
jgi:hypothetical protein